MGTANLVVPESSYQKSGSPKVSVPGKVESIRLVDDKWFQIQKQQKIKKSSSLAKEFNVGLDLNEGVVDTGATNALTNYVIAKKLSEKTGRPILEWPQPIIFQFANAERNQSLHYIDGGLLLGKISILESAPCSLVSIWNLVQSNCSVNFSSDSVKVVYSFIDSYGSHQQCLLYTGQVWSARKMWYLDLEALMLLQLPDSVTSVNSVSLSHSSSESTVHAALRKQRLSDHTVNTIRELHR